jgi:CubicO group peptidase (beta-lactamase class C family)
VNRRRLLVAALAAPALVRAQGGASWQRSFSDWATQHGVQAGNIAALRGGRLVHATGFGSRPAQARAPIWSLSKSITAAAIAQLIGAGRLALDTPLGAAMPQTFRGHGVATDTPLALLSIEQLLTHRSGLALDSGVPLRAWLNDEPPAAIPLDRSVPYLLRTRVEQPPGSEYRYSNTGYLLLGLVIAELTGRTYHQALASGLLADAGIRNATLDPDWHAFTSTGGWRLSPAEYLAFANHTLLTNRVIPPALRAWMTEPRGKLTGANPNFLYSLGLIVETRAAGVNFFHTGGWTWTQAARHGAVSTNSASQFLVAPSGTAWCATFQPHPGNEARNALWRALWPCIASALDESGRDLFPGLLGAAS